MSKYKTETFKVSRQGCIAVQVSATTQLLNPGTLITPELRNRYKLDDKTIDEHLRSGYLLRQRHEPDPHEAAPGVSVDQHSVVHGEKAIQTSDSSTDITTSAGRKEPANPVVQVQSIWTLDPAGLQNKSLEELNVLVAERDSTIEPFETKEEAIAQLSQDFQSPAE